MKDFNLYKRIISLPDFLRDNFGFENHAKGSTKNNPKLTDGQTTLVVGKKNNMFYYFDVNYPDIRKTILDFMQENISTYNKGEKPPLPFVANLLDRYIVEGKTVLPEFSTFNLNNPTLSQDDIYRNIINLSTSGSNDFLTKRGISEKTITSKFFKESIKYRKVPHLNKFSHDVAFVMHSIDKSRAISYRGYRDDLDSSFKGFHGPKSQCIASSTFDPSKPLDKIFIGESMIDNMAYLELNYKNLADLNILFLSSEGSLSSNQIFLVQKTINNLQPLSFNTILDNDLYGSQATCLILSEIKLPNSLLKMEQGSFASQNLLNLSRIEVNITGEKTPRSFIRINSPFCDKDSFSNAIKAITEKLNGNIAYKKDLFSISSQETSNGKTHTIEFANHTQNWKRASSLVIDYKFGSSDFVKSIFPKTKDFNLDLIEYKGLTVAKTKPKSNDKELSI